MAATRLIALHKNRGKSVAACLKSRTDYAKNPDKTNKGELVSSYECSPLTADEEFMLSKRQYELVTGRRQKNDVIAYQIRQSFKPGEITAEEANKVGYELAMRFTKGKYAFIVATHTDREHIHNHIIYNSTALDSTRKFRDFLLSGLAVQRLRQAPGIQPLPPCLLRLMQQSLQWLMRTPATLPTRLFTTLTSLTMLMSSPAICCTLYVSDF